MTHKAGQRRAAVTLRTRVTRRAAAASPQAPRPPNIDARLALGALCGIRPRGCDATSLDGALALHGARCRRATGSRFHTREITLFACRRAQPRAARGSKAAGAATCLPPLPVDATRVMTHQSHVTTCRYHQRATAFVRLQRDETIQLNSHTSHFLFFWTRASPSNGSPPSPNKTNCF